MKRNLIALPAGAGALFAALFVSGTARAQEMDAPKKVESPQHFAIELRFAPYWPAIDSQPGLTGKPYQEIFGKMARLLFAGEFDWQVVRIPHLGTLGPGLSFGYTEMSAPAPLTGGGGVSGEQTNIEVFPFYGVAVLRVDVLWHDYKVPFIPYVKAGIAGTIWHTFTDSGTSHYNGTTGFGVTWGEQFAAGGALALNWLDPRAAAAMDQQAGINTTYLFAEWMWANLDNFGSSSAFRVGTMTVCAGLGVEF